MMGKSVSKIALMLLGATAGAQEPMTIGIIEFYGLRSVTEEQVRAALPFSEGFVASAEDAFSEEEAESDIAASLGVSRVDLSLVCCYEPNRAIAYVGLEEASNATPRFRHEPDGEAELPTEVVETQRQIESALIAAIRAGDAGEDTSQGHSLAMNPEVRALQEKNIDYANEYFDVLVDVLCCSASQRDLAASILGYAADKKSVIPHLLPAVVDPDEEVRNNATRALYVIAAYAKENPELGIEIDGMVFVDMLNSVWFDDRNKASALLSYLTESRDPALMQKIRNEALPSLIEMCDWDVPGHSYFACRILERAVGLPDRQDLYPKDTTIGAALEISEARAGSARANR